MNRTDRLFALAEELRAAGEQGCTSTGLAALFEVSTRTIKRDMLALAEAGIPVWGADGRNGGYRLAARSRTLPKVEFTEREATAMAVALASQGNSPFAPEARSALRKIMRSLPEDAATDVEALGRRIWTSAAPSRRGTSARIVDEALRDRRVVHIDYEDLQGARSRRRPIEPIAYAQHEGQWYVLAWCRWREAGRSFRLNRITRAFATRERAPERTLDEDFGRAPRGARTIEIPR